MSEGMPYTLEKGPYFSIIEDFVNGGSPRRAADALSALRSGASIAEIGPLSAPGAGTTRTPTDLLVKHVKADWFGWQPGPPAEPTPPQPAFDRQTNPTTGFWKYWYGDCEGVLRETLVRALEVCLGVDHGADPPDPDNPPRRWLLDMFWRCPQPWFEGWVTWREHGKGPREGQVTVLVSSPGHGYPLRTTPVRNPAETGPEYELGPTTASGTQGVWCISQRHHRRWVPDSTKPSRRGKWDLPVLHHESRHDVVVVSLAEHEGGVRPDGRPYDGQL
jgi:hypothetical protein